MKIWRKAKKQGKKFEYDADTIRKLNELNKNI